MVKVLQGPQGSCGRSVRCRCLVFGDAAGLACLAQVEHTALPEHVPSLTVQKHSAVLLAIVGVEKTGEEVVATVEGVIPIKGTEAEVAAKVGVFYQLAQNFLEVGTAEPDTFEVRTRARCATAGPCVA